MPNGYDDPWADHPHALQPFVACKKHTGSRQGMVFKTGQLGLGYYPDTGRVPVSRSAMMEIHTRMPAMQLNLSEWIQEQPSSAPPTSPPEAGTVSKGSRAAPN